MSCSMFIDIATSMTSAALAVLHLVVEGAMAECNCSPLVVTNQSESHHIKVDGYATAHSCNIRKLDAAVNVTVDCWHIWSYLVSCCSLREWAR